MEIYLSVKGAKQGNFKADEMIGKSHAGQMKLLSFDMGTSVPFDLSSGMSSGKRMHQPVKFTKIPDQQGPAFMNALWQNEVLPTAKFYFWRASNQADAKAGGEVNYVTVELTNALMTKVATVTGSFTSSTGVETARIEEHYEMTYQKVEYTWVKGGISAADDWSTPS